MIFHVPIAHQYVNYTHPSTKMPTRIVLKILFALLSETRANFAVSLPDQWFFAGSMKLAALSWIKNKSGLWKPAAIR